MNTFEKILFCVEVGILSFVIGVKVGVDWQQYKDAAAGVARYVVNPTNGQVNFIYGDIQKP